MTVVVLELAKCAHPFCRRESRKDAMQKQRLAVSVPAGEHDQQGEISTIIGVKSQDREDGMSQYLEKYNRNSLGRSAWFV